MRDTIRLTREQLYEQVWTEPMTALAGRYGLSNVALAKICVKARIPRPPRGYWQKKAAGKMPRRPALPPARPSDPAEITLVVRPQRETVRSPSVDAQEEYESRVEHRLSVPATLEEPVREVARTAAMLRRAKIDERGILQPRKRGGLDVRVSPDTLDRALRIMETVVRAVRDRGMEISMGDSVRGETRVTVHGESIAICLEEPVRRVDHVPTSEEQIQKATGRWVSMPRYDYHPTGTLSLRLLDSGWIYNSGIRKVWADRKRRRVEDCLNDFLVGLIQAAEAIKAERRRKEELQRQWEEQARLRREREILRLEEEKRARSLDQEIEAWIKASRARSYIAAVEAAATEEHGSIEPASELGQWLEWAWRYVDREDPVLRRAGSGSARRRDAD